MRRRGDCSDGRVYPQRLPVTVMAEALAEVEADIAQFLDESDRPAELVLDSLLHDEGIPMETTEFNWPLGHEGDRTLVVLGADADLIAPLLDGEPEPEDGNVGKWVPLGIPNLEADPEMVAEELSKGSDDVYVVLPRSEDAYAFCLGLDRVMIEAKMTVPAYVFLPEPLTLETIVRQLPSRGDDANLGVPSRHNLFVRALVLAWIACAPEEQVAEFLLAQLDPDVPAIV